MFCVFESVEKRGCVIGSFIVRETVREMIIIDNTHLEHGSG